MKYKYWVRSYSPAVTDAGELERTFNRVDLEGWELVSMSDGFIVFRQLVGVQR